jgi:hypothetical protein
MTTTPRQVTPRLRTIRSAVVLMVVGLAGFFAFRMMWGLMKLGHVDSAIGRMRALSTAESQFAKVHPEFGYTCTLSQLPPSPEIARLIAKRGTDNGYVFEILGCQMPTRDRPNSTYYSTARPLHSGQPAFCSDQSGVLRADYSGSIERCRTNGVPL